MDHLNAALGMAYVEITEWPDAEEVRQKIRTVQLDLFSLGAFVSSADPSYLNSVKGSAEEFEKCMDRLMPHFKLDGFVLPGSNRAEAALHNARTVCRTLERHLVLLEASRSDERVARYVNRLSDMLFVLALWAGTPGKRPPV